MGDGTEHGISAMPLTDAPSLRQLTETKDPFAALPDIETVALIPLTKAFAKIPTCGKTRPTTFSCI